MFKGFIANLPKQNFMNWAAGAILIHYIINSVYYTVFLLSSIKTLTPIVFERMMNQQITQQISIVTMVLLYYFSTKNLTNEKE